MSTVIVNINNRESIRARAQVLVNKKPFSKEDKSEFDALLGLLDHLEKNAGTRDVDRRPKAGEFYNDDPPEHRAAYLHFLRGGGSHQVAEWMQKRDMTVTTDASGGFFVPEGFSGQIKAAAKAHDRLFDGNVVTVIESNHGNQFG